MEKFQSSADSCVLVVGFCLFVVFKWNKNPKWVCDLVSPQVIESWPRKHTYILLLIAVFYGGFYYRSVLVEEKHLFIFEPSCSASLLRQFPAAPVLYVSSAAFNGAALCAHTLQLPQNDRTTRDVSAYYATALACHPLVKAAERGMLSRSSKHTLACCHQVAFLWWTPVILQRSQFRQPWCLQVLDKLSLVGNLPLFYMCKRNVGKNQLPRAHTNEFCARILGWGCCGLQSPRY